MQPTVPTAKQVIIDLIEKGISDPGFAPVHLAATLDSVEATSVRVDLVRNHESMWSGKSYHSQMRGETSSYPSLNLSLFPWSLPEHTPVSSVRDGTLRAEMQRQINTVLAATPFSMRPLGDKSRSWQKVLCSEEGLPRLYFELFRKEGTPE